MMVHLEFNLTSIVMLLQFVLLAFFLYKLLYKPFFKMSDERRNKIQQDISTAERLRAEAEESRKKAKELVESAQAQAESIIENAKRTADALTGKEKELAKRQAETILKKAQDEIETQKQEAVKEISEKSIKLAVYLASKLLERQIDEKTQSEYLRSFISRIQEGGSR
jgi:F-type H+-transporting ATPase subunit b